MDKQQIEQTLKRVILLNYEKVSLATIQFYKNEIPADVYQERLSSLRGSLVDTILSVIK